MSDAATCWCSYGAMLRAGWKLGHNEPVRYRAYIALAAAAGRRGHTTPLFLNDAKETTHADVLAMFDDAIAETRRKMEAA